MLIGTVNSVYQISPTPAWTPSPEVATWEPESEIHDDYIDEYEASLEAEAELEAEEDAEGDEDDEEED